MADSVDTSGGSGGGGMHLPPFLTKKYGPLSGWAWGLIGAVGLGLVLFIRAKRAGGSGTSTAAATAPVGTPVGSGATGFTQDQLGQLSGIINGDVASGLANAAPGSVPGAAAPATNPLASYVNSEFTNILGRAPEASAATFYQNQLANGQSASQQFLDLSGSGEAQQRASTPQGAQAFITGQYETLLNRQPDAAGLAHWTTVLNNAHGNTGVEAAQFLQAAQPELKAQAGQ